MLEKVVLRVFLVDPYPKAQQALSSIEEEEARSLFSVLAPGEKGAQEQGELRQLILKGMLHISLVHQWTHARCRTLQTDHFNWMTST